MTRGKSRKRHWDQGNVQMKMIIPKQDKMKIATPPAQCTSTRRGRPEELTEMNPSKPLQTVPKIGNDYTSSIGVRAYPWILIKYCVCLCVCLFTTDYVGVYTFGINSLHYLWNMVQMLNIMQPLYCLVWATKLSLAAIGLVFLVLVLGYKSFNCSMYQVPVRTWFG